MNVSRSMWVAALALAAAGCGSSPHSVYSPYAGSLALSRHDAYLYAADSDNNIVAIIDTSNLTLVTQVNVGVGPERLAVAPDETLYVTNRGERSVSVIKYGTWEELARIPVGVEPVGVAVSPDNKMLYVVNATSLQDPSTGTLMAIDTKSRSLQWELAVGEEPRGIALLDNGNVAVTLYKQGDVVTVNPSGPSIVFASTNLMAAANVPANIGFGGVNGGGPTPQGGEPKLPPGAGVQESFHPRGMGSITVGPDGKTLFTTLLWDSDGRIPLSSSVVVTDAGAPDAGDCTGGGYGGGGGGGMGGGPVNQPGTGSFGCVLPNDPNPPNGTVVLAGLATFDGNAGTPQVDAIAARGVGIVNANFPASVLRVQEGGIEPVQEPVAAVADPTGSWVFVVNRASNNVAILPMTRSSTSSSTGAQPVPFNGTGAQPWKFLEPVGAGPNGIALTHDGTRAYVYNAFDHTVSVLVGGGGAVQVAPGTLQVAHDTLSADEAQGRKLFFSAVNPSVAAQNTSISCGSCHLEGREDGQVWHFLDGPRQTPALVGRMLDQTAPYHWSGALPTLHTFMDVTIAQRMGGSGLDATSEQQIARFLAAAPMPDNPFRGAALTASQQRGAQVFQRANCASCHAGAAMTNNAFANVGTLDTSDPIVPDDFSAMPNGLNVPSLLGVGRSAPYLHSGAAPTLKDRITMNKSADQHGNTSTLSEGDVDDLVAFLKTL